jgi:hypothetical protein
VFDRLLIATVLVAALAAVLPLVAAGGAGKAPKLGEKAPPFSLLDLDGQRVTFDGELTRGPVVLVLLRGWPGYQCPFCTRQFADFLGHASAFEAAGGARRLGLSWSVRLGPATRQRVPGESSTAVGVSNHH